MSPLRRLVPIRDRAKVKFRWIKRDPHHPQLTGNKIQINWASCSKRGEVTFPSYSHRKRPGIKIGTISKGNRGDYSTQAAPWVFGIHTGKFTPEFGTIFSRPCSEYNQHHTQNPVQGHDT